MLQPKPLRCTQILELHQYNSTGLPVGSVNGCPPGEEDTDLVQKVSGTLSKDEHSPVGGQDFCVIAIIT